MSETKKQDDQIQTVQGQSSKPVRKRIPTANIAHAIYQRLKTDSESEAIARARLQSMFDGNPPYSKVERKRLGLSWLANVDWGEFRSSITLNASSIWNMMSNLPRLVDLISDEVDPQNPYADYGKIIAEEYTRIMFDWKDYHYNEIFATLEMLKFGKGPVFWPDEIDWKYRPLRNANVKVPWKAKSTIGGLNTFTINEEKEFYEIMDVLSDETKAEEIGWNVKFLKEVVIKIAAQKLKPNSGDKFGTSDWESAQAMIKNYTDAGNSEFDGIRLVHFYVEELPSTDNENKNRITHLIIWEDDPGTDAKGQSKKSYQFVFEKERQFESMDQVIHLMLFNIGDGLYKSVRGLGREIFSYCDVSNRFLNDTLNGVFLRTGLVLQAESGNDASKMMGQTIHHGPVTIFPAGLRFHQQNILPNLGDVISARSVFQALSNNNTGMYKAHNENNQTVARTAAEVELEAQNEARFENNQAEWYYVQREERHRETLRRLMNPKYKPEDPGYEQHKLFMDRCKARKVPIEFLKYERWNLKAVRSIGLGSPTMRMSITSQLMGTIQFLDEQGRKELLTEYYDARVHWKNTQRFVSSMSRDLIPNQEMQIAQFENKFMKTGEEMIVAADDIHKLHCDSHLRSIGEDIQMYKQGMMDAATAARTIELKLKHTMEHIAILNQDPTRKGQVTQYIGLIDQAKKMYDAILAQAKNIAAMKEQAQQAQGQIVEDARQLKASQDFEAKKYEIDRNFELEKYKAELLHEARMVKAQTSIQAMVQKAIQDMNIKDVQSAKDIQRKDAETMAKIARKNTEASTT